MTAARIVGHMLAAAALIGALQLVHAFEHRASTPAPCDPQTHWTATHHPCPSTEPAR